MSCARPSPSCTAMSKACSTACIHATTSTWAGAAGARRMARLLEDLQTLSTAQAGALRLYSEPTDVATLSRCR